jgi:glutathione peroxidase
MKTIITFFFIMFGFLNNASANYTKLAYDFQFKGIDGKIIKLSNYQNKVIVVVNVASRCGFTNQYDDLQRLWTSYRDKGLVIVGIPTNNFKQEPGSNSEIKDFCETNFDISFPMSEKTNVIGNDSHPFFNWAKENYGLGAVPKWNFHKIIIGKDGKVANTFASITNPSSKKFINFVEKEIKN